MTKGSAEQNRQTTKRGSVLIVCLVMLVLFATLSAGLYKICSARINLAKKVDEITICKQTAYAMCEVTLRDLQEDKSTYHTLYELRTPQLKNLGLAEVVYYFIDEESRLNINNASEEMLERFEALDEKAVHSIYASILKPYSLKEELLLVEDLKKEEYEGIENFITIYGPGAVNINTSSREVLIALGLDASLVADIINFRAGPDGEEMTEDDNFFQGTGQIVSELENNYGLFKEDKEKLEELISANLLSTKSSYFSMQLEIKVKGRLAKNYAIILNKNGVVEWREN
jgi:type II secretory pathway component PulK